MPISKTFGQFHVKFRFLPYFDWFRHLKHLSDYFCLS